MKTKKILATIALKDLPEGVWEAVKLAQSDREQAEKAVEQAKKSTLEAIKVLAALKISERTIGELLGLSHQGVRFLRGKSER